jgi:hypothetical protein
MQKKNSLEIPVVWRNGETDVPTVKIAGSIDSYTTIYGTVDGKTDFLKIYFSF